MLPPDFQRKEVNAPPLQFDQGKRANFDHLLATAAADPSRPIQYNCAYPKYEFLTYLAVYHPVVLHGSNNPAIAIFEPRLTTDWAGRPLQAVYAAADGIWPMFFAIVHRKPYPYSLHNGCAWAKDAAGQPTKVYHFAISMRVLRDQPWTNGMIYVLPRDTFVQVRDAAGQITEEWASLTSVRPIAKLTITPDDFLFLRDVQGMNDRWSELEA
jgi:hypothetical protein